jgi:hypothetical protein
MNIKSKIMKSENFITVRTYQDAVVADLIVAALHNADIQVFRLDETHTRLPGDNVEIRVLEKDVDKALQIIEAQELG